MDTTNTANLTVNLKDPPKPLGPDSYTWQDFGSYLYQLMLPQAFLMQVAHPVIEAAVSKDKKYKVDPWGRARDSIARLWPVIYARPEKAIEMGLRLREMHRQIKGVDKNGKAYHALDPEAYAWVYITGFDATVRLHEYYRAKLTLEVRAQIFKEWKQIGSLLGVPQRNIPQTEEEYWKHFHYMIDERLRYGEVVEDLLSVKHFGGLPKPPVVWFPEIIWRILAPLLGWIQIKITIATLPERFRHKLGLSHNIKYSKVDAAAFRVFAWSVRKLYPRLPQFMRYLPLANAAIEDARQNPDAYRFDETATALVPEVVESEVTVGEPTITGNAVTDNEIARA